MPLLFTGSKCPGSNSLIGTPGHLSFTVATYYCRLGTLAHYILSALIAS